MEQGIILSGVGGIYQVKTEQALVPCTLRGRLRLNDDRVLVGDKVEISTSDEGVGVVENILPRHSELVRPAIANVEQVVVIFAVENPAPNYLLLDRILVQAELMNLSNIVVFNKADLNPALGQQRQAEYAAIYPTVVTSTLKETGLTELKSLIQGKITTLAGPSGAGKSSLLNALDPSLDLEIGELSAKVQRGKHTTRTVQLLAFGNGYVADTPGFSQLTLGRDQEDHVQYAFPEFDHYRDSCQFRGCLHRLEPKCAVKEAVQTGQILARRYENYLVLLKEAAPTY